MKYIIIPIMARPEITRIQAKTVITLFFGYFIFPVTIAIKAVIKKNRLMPIPEYIERKLRGKQTANNAA
jgi:hypothetical protein